MYGRLRETLNKFVSLSDSEFTEFTDRLTSRALEKDELFLREGEVCNHCIFIDSGCLRYYLTVDGEEKTGQFFFEGGWYVDLESFLTGQPSEQNIQALEPSQCFLMHKKALYELYAQRQIFERLGRLLAEHGFLGIRRKNQMLTNLSPEERYIDLMNTRPKVIERVPLMYIASYLGIQPESLSRIRRRIFENRKQR